MSALYLNNSFKCGVCSNAFTKEKLFDHYEVESFSWDNSTVTITKNGSKEPLTNKDIAAINGEFQSKPQYANYRVYRNISDMTQDQENMRKKQWLELLLSVSGFMVVSLLNLLALYVQSLLLQQVLSVFCGVVCLVSIVYLGYDILKWLPSRFIAFKACISDLGKSRAALPSLYEALLAFIIVAILAQSLVTMGYGFFIGHMLCMNHFHCPLMIATSFYAKRWLSSKVYSDMSVFKDSDSYKEYLKNNNGELHKGQSVFFDSTLDSESAEFETGYTNGERQTIRRGGGLKFGWICISDGPVTIKKNNNAEETGESVHKMVNQAEIARNKRRADLFSMRRTLFLVGLIAIAIIAPICWHIFAAGFGMAASFDMAFSIILIACPCRDFVKSFCYYLACRDLPSTIHLKGVGVYELLDDIVGISYILPLSKIKMGFDWTNTLQRDESSDSERWSIKKLRAETPQVLRLLRKYASGIGVYSGTRRFNGQDTEGYKKSLGIDEFFVGLARNNKEEQVKGIDLYIGDNFNDILAGLKAKVFVAMKNEGAMHGPYNPIRYADIVLDDTLEPLPELFQAIAIARKTSYIVGVINTIYNICALFLACGGYFYLFGSFLSPIAASFIMLGSMVLNLWASIAFTALFMRFAYSSLASLCEIDEGLGVLEEKRVIESALGYAHKDRTHAEIANFAEIASGRYSYGYKLFTIGNYVITTRGILGRQEYTTRCRLGAIAQRWQEKVSSRKDQAAVSDDFCFKHVTSFISYIRSCASASSYSNIINN